MEKGREGFYFFIYAKEAGVKRYLQVGDAIEFGCKFQPDPSIKPERIFWWGCCSGLSATEARFIRAENPLKAIEMGHSIVEALAFADLSEDSISVEISRIEARQLEIQQEWERLEQQKETLKAGKKTC
jgi:hypothetical protein